MIAPVSKTMKKRYLPQYRQFHVALQQRGAGYIGAAENEMGRGYAWALPISEHCLVIGHDLVPARDVDLVELTPSPYACASEMSISTIEVMSELNFQANQVKTARKSPLKMPACTFMTEDTSDLVSPLKQGQRYFSRAILFEPEFFRDLERRYPRQFEGLFSAFGGTWNEDASQAICAGLHGIQPGQLAMPGAHLHAKSVVEHMIARLAAANSAQAVALERDGLKPQTALVRSAFSLVERELFAGHQLTIDELAQDLYVSRSTLCAAFKQETGENLGAYMRRRRAERAEELLLDSKLSIAEVAQALGFPRPQAFAQAFKQAHGISPTQFRRG